MSLQRPPSNGKVREVSDDARSEPDGGGYYADFRKKDYKIPLTSVSIGFGFKRDGLKFDYHLGEMIIIINN